MALEGDIILGQNNQITFKNGDINIGDAKEQHVAAILNASKGNFRRHPTLGVDIVKKIDSPQDLRLLEQDIRIELEKDGYQLKEMDITTSNNEITNIKIIDINCVFLAFTVQPGNCLLNICRCPVKFQE